MPVTTCFLRWNPHSLKLLLVIGVMLIAVGCAPLPRHVVMPVSAMNPFIVGAVEQDASTSDEDATAINAIDVMVLTAGPRAMSDAQIFSTYVERSTIPEHILFRVRDDDADEFKVADVITHQALGVDWKYKVIWSKADPVNQGFVIVYEELAPFRVDDVRIQEAAAL